MTYRAPGIAYNNEASLQKKKKKKKKNEIFYERAVFLSFVFSFILLNNDGNKCICINNSYKCKEVLILSNDVTSSCSHMRHPVSNT